DLARMRADEDPLVRGRPGDQQPAAVRRENELPKGAGPGEDRPLAVHEHDSAGGVRSSDDGDAVSPGQERSVDVDAAGRRVVLGEEDALETEDAHTAGTENEEEATVVRPGELARTSEAFDEERGARSGAVDDHSGRLRVDEQPSSSATS